MNGKTETDISNAELINGLQHMADDHPCCKDTISMTIDQLKQLERENAALRADKERLDWLETNGREQVYGPTWRIAWQFGQDVSLRAAIDAARKEAQS